MKKIIIGVTDCSKYEKYASWIKAYSPDVETIKLSEKTQNLNDVQQCHGILFTGGEDVHPRFYGKPEYLSYCYADDINEARDEFEMRLMDYTEGNEIPVLGICRGLQIYNVYRGGTLVPDIPSWAKDNSQHAKGDDGQDSYHSAILTTGSLLQKITGLSQGEINSNHHQSVDDVAEGFLVSARSDDGFIEAIDQLNPSRNNLICLVQWHPERMKDQESPLAKNIREAFMKASQNLVY